MIAETMASSDTLLAIRGLKKNFVGQPALAGVDFELRRGEIHALLGENGAGKSTLIKILAGVVEADAGEIDVAVASSSRSTASARALAFVHQDLGLIETLSVAENIALEIGYRRRGGFISQRRTEDAIRSVMARVGPSISPHTLVGDLHQHERVLVAVARALSQDAQIVVFDEVSASLAKPEVRRLMAPLRGSLRSGTGYVYVTHRLTEVFELADRVTVLRDGKHVATANVADVDHDQLVDWIVGEGREAVDRSTRGRKLAPESRLPGACANGGLTVRGLTGPGLVAPTDVNVARGEILGVCGLVGSGARELIRLIGGAAPADSGHVALDGTVLPLGSRHRLSALGCEFVAGDRLTEGGIVDLSVRENFFPMHRRGQAPEDGFIRRPRRERAAANRLIERFDVRPRGSAERALLTLSGGNQQKVVLGRALRTEPRLLVLDDPTAGVDVGSRQELHQILREAASNRAVIVLASTDFEEIVHLADRALVMCDGAICVEFDGAHFTEDDLAEASYGAAASTVEAEDESCV